MKIYYLLDKERGEVLFDGIKYEITSRNYIPLVQKRMRDIIDLPTSLFLFSAFRNSFLVWSSLLYNSKDPERKLGKIEIIINMLEHFPRLGYGVGELVEYDEKSLEFKIRIKNNFNALLFKDEQQPNCHVMRGMLAGIFEVVFQRKVEAREIKCKSVGDEACEFEIVLKEKSEEAERYLAKYKPEKYEEEKLEKVEIEFKEEKGEIIYRGSNSAAIVRGYSAIMQRESERILGEAAKTIITISKEAAKEVMNTWVVKLARIFSKKKIIEEAMKQIPEGGWGVGELVEFDEKEPYVKLRVKNSFNACGYENMKKPVCYDLAAVIEGVCEVIFKRAMKCRETKCRGMGDPYCEFEVRPKEE